MDYQTYIQSDAWREKSKSTIAARGAICQECGRADTLGVHHVSYDRMGQEAEEDLKVLCVCCHSTEHVGKLVRHGRVGCVSLVFTGEGPRAIDAMCVVFCITGVRARRQIVRVDQYPRAEGVQPHTIFSDVLDLFEARARSDVLNAISRAVGDNESFFAEQPLLDLTAQIPLIDEREGPTPAAETPSAADQAG